MEYNLTNEFQSLKADQGYYLITIGMYKNEPTVLSKLPIVGWRLEHSEDSSSADPITVGDRISLSSHDLHTQGIQHPDGLVYDFSGEIYIGNVGQEYDEWFKNACLWLNDLRIERETGSLPRGD
jgi:hypothetical protein